MKKQTRKRPNQSELQKIIDEGRYKKFTYLIKKKNDIEFTLPEENHANRMLFHNKPLVRLDDEGKLSETGRLGHPKKYFIPKVTNDKLINLFKVYQIPENLHADLTVAFLNMYFSSCEADFSTNFHAQLKKHKKELFATLDFLEEVQQDKKLIRGVSIEYKDITVKGDKRIYGRLKAIKYKGYIAVQFIEKVLQNYKLASAYTTAQSTYNDFKKYGETDVFMGHKNAAKQHQSYFASSIFDYLRKHLFSSAFEHFDNDRAFQDAIKKLKQKYSRRKMYNFIGDLMMLSELLKLKGDADREDIIENIEKKLIGKLRNEKKYLQNSRTNKSESSNGQIEAIPFSKLF